MKKSLTILINGIIILIVSPLLLVGSIPFVLFKGYTSATILDDYFHIWGLFLNMLAYPLTKYEERKEFYEDLKIKIKQYREECSRLNKIIDELEKDQQEEEL